MKNNTNLAKGLTIQEVAKQTGMSEHNLRYYERAGLLQQIYRDSSSKHRRYSASDIAKIETLTCLRALGMPLGQMRRYFELISQGKEAAPKLQRLLEIQKQVLEERMQQMQQHLEYVQYKIAYWQAVESEDNQAIEEITQKVTEQMRVYARCSIPKFSVFDNKID